MSILSLPQSLKATYCLEWRCLGFVSDLEKQVLCLELGEEVAAAGHSLLFNECGETCSMGNTDRN